MNTLPKKGHILFISIALALPTSICFSYSESEKNMPEQKRQQLEKKELNRDKMQMRKEKHTVYGWDLMSKEERIEHRNKMRSFKTEKERNAYQIEHHKKMNERAKARGMTLPEKPMRKKDRGGRKQEIE